MHIGLDAAAVRTESRKSSGVTWPLAHHTAKRTCAVADVANRTGQSGPPLQ